MLNVIDEFTRECIAIRVERKLKAVDVIDVLSDLFILRGIARVSMKMAGDKALPFRVTTDGETVSGKFAAVKKSHEFTFVPRRPLIDR